MIIEAAIVIVAVLGVALGCTVVDALHRMRDVEREAVCVYCDGTGWIPDWAVRNAASFQCPHCKVAREESPLTRVRGAEFGEQTSDSASRARSEHPSNGGAA